MDESEPTLFGGHSPGVETHDLKTVAGLLALTSLAGIGSGRAIKLARVFGSADAFNEASPAQRRQVAGVAVDGFITLREIEPPHGSVRLLGYFDDDYPRSLRDIKDAPAVLWMRGQLPDPARRIAIVGTRVATRWGLSMAEATATDAAHVGVSVVSGLALGIDIAAHRAALRAHGHTTAVIGSGIDKVSPVEHRAASEEIVASGGCVLTEQAPGTSASARTLVARNRLQSGLSAATIVVQCGLKSGTMSTAKFTVEQRKVLAVPEPPEAERDHSENAGSISLLEGCPPPRVLRSRDDLKALLGEIA